MAVTAACSVMMMAGCSGNNERQDNMETLGLTQEWDKVFPESDKVEHSKAVFRNRYGITLAADVYIPAGASGKLPAIAVCGPFGAVKELMIIPGANHTDLYDTDKIPFAHIRDFFSTYLK